MFDETIYDFDIYVSRLIIRLHISFQMSDYESFIYLLKESIEINHIFFNSIIVHYHISLIFQDGLQIFLFYICILFIISNN